MGPRGYDPHIPPWLRPCTVWTIWLQNETCNSKLNIMKKDNGVTNFFYCVIPTLKRALGVFENQEIMHNAYKIRVIGLAKTSKFRYLFVEI